MKRGAAQSDRHLNCFQRELPLAQEPWASTSPTIGFPIVAIKSEPVLPFYLLIAAETARPARYLEKRSPCEMMYKSCKIWVYLALYS